MAEMRNFLILFHNINKPLWYLALTRFLGGHCARSDSGPGRRRDPALTRRRLISSPCETDLAPALSLYLGGDREVLSRPGIAMVGRRHPLGCGTGTAGRLACDLAVSGFYQPTAAWLGVWTLLAVAVLGVSWGERSPLRRTSHPKPDS